MDIRYTFGSLKELADWLDEKAKSTSIRMALNKKGEAFIKGEAYAYKSIADILRNTTIGESEA